jgi:hypothetical protein
MGSRYDVPGFEEMRRLSLPRSRCHVYYDIDDDGRHVRVHAIWHSSRGSGPAIG